MPTLVADAPALSTAKAAQTAIRTILVHVRAGDDDAPRLKSAAALARKLDATLYGLGAEMPPPLGTMDPTGLMQGEWYVEMRKQAEQNLELARQVFRAETQGLKADWAWIEDMPGEALARASRGADLIVAGGAPIAADDRYRFCDTAELVLTSGRPVLIVPPKGGELSARAVVVGWKDTRESRRALADALPFLANAESVTVVEVCRPDEREDAALRTAAVAAGLKRHGIDARTAVVAAPSERVTAELDAAADAIGADLIVAGGYGHTRLGEWVFGGVTRDLLRHPERFVLLSH